MKNSLLLIVFTLLTIKLSSQESFLTGIRAIGTPHDPKVKMSWNRYHTLDQIKDFADRLKKAYPDFVLVESIGKSYEGRDIWAITINNKKTGGHLTKPAFYIQGNIHANELQGCEISMYTAWYLLENYNDMPFIKELVDEKVFYILPTINPDGHHNFMTQPNNASSPRSGVIPMDDDGDWEIDEDNFDDLDGDGHITMMRRKNPNGRWKVDPEYPSRMVMAGPDEKGEYEMLGQEGIDRDGDGRVNEDRTGYYDPNRDWGWNWQPDYVQSGSMKYPFSTPEIRAVKEYVIARPNIAGAQSYHNYGGMFLRGPGSEEDLGTYPREDVQVYDILGKRGEKVVPGYNYLIGYKDLYSVYGGDLDYFHGSLGIFTFVNEIMNSYLFFHTKSERSRWSDNTFQEADKFLLFGDGYVDWKPFNHPQFGEIEIGGPKKNFIRNTPGFLMEEDAHRNMAFTLYHAYHTPKIEFTNFGTKDLGNGLQEISVSVTNQRAIPTHSAHDVKNKIERPNIIKLKGAEVISGFLMENKDLNMGTEQSFDPANLRVPTIRGNSTIHLKWIVKNKIKEYTVEFEGKKAGTVSKTFKVD